MITMGYSFITTGLESMVDKLSEFSLARKDANSVAWINGMQLAAQLSTFYNIPHGYIVHWI